MCPRREILESLGRILKAENPVDDIIKLHLMLCYKRIEILEVQAGSNIDTPISNISVSTQKYGPSRV